MRNSKTAVGQVKSAWYEGKTINEVLFCKEFLEQHPMKCIRGRMYTVDGPVEDEGEIQQMILE